MARLLWLVDAAQATGYPVVEVNGWQTRGSILFNPKALIWHHTAGPTTGDMPSLNILINGRTGIPGPLSQYGLGRSGSIYVVASGRAHHAGAGGWAGLSGNGSVVGIEAEHTGRSGVAWPAVQLDAYRKLSAQILRRLGVSPLYMCGHKEWAPTRKIDPIDLDMNNERARVAALLTNPTQEDDMWQYLNIDESLVRHAWDQGWLQPKTTATLNYFLNNLAELQKGDQSAVAAGFREDWLNFRRAVTNGIARGGKQGPPGKPGSGLTESQVETIVNQNIAATSLTPPA